MRAGHSLTNLVALCFRCCFYELYGARGVGCHVEAAYFKWRSFVRERNDSLLATYVSSDTSCLCRLPSLPLPPKHASAMAKLSPLTLIFIAACLSRILHLTVLSGLSKALPLFDTSPSLLLSSPPPALRWDAIHFASVAYNGYEYEQQVAFQPGWLAVMRLAGEGVRFIRAASVVELKDVILGGTIVANVAFVAATLVLYK